MNENQVNQPKEIKELKRYVLLANNEFIDTQRTTNRINKPELYYENENYYLAFYKRFDVRGGIGNPKLLEFEEKELYSDSPIVDTSDNPKDLIRANDYITLIGNDDFDLLRVYKNYYRGNLFVYDHCFDRESIEFINIKTIYKWINGKLCPVWSVYGEDVHVYQDEYIHWKDKIR